MIEDDEASSSTTTGHRRRGARTRGLPLAAALLGFLAAISGPAWASEASNKAAHEASNTPAPNLASQSCTFADKAHAEGNLQAAIELYTTCVKTANLTPEQRAGILINRGNAYFRLGEQEMAAADFDGAIELTPNSATAYYNRGLAAFVIGRYDEAIANSSEAIRIDPGMASAYYNRGAAYANQRDFPKAIADLTEAVRLRPDWALAYRSRGDAYLRSGAPEKGALDHAEAKRLDPKLGQPPTQ
jgi:tetratricopeptide (TPR) repeat protein